MTGKKQRRRKWTVCSGQLAVLKASRTCTAGRQNASNRNNFFSELHSRSDHVVRRSESTTRRLVVAGRYSHAFYDRTTWRQALSFISPSCAPIGPNRMGEARCDVTSGAGKVTGEHTRAYVGIWSWLPRRSLGSPYDTKGKIKKIPRVTPAAGL
jgi:hypothetical protein